ncbi:pentatricopeptide repeat-containing protein At2g01860 isoform X2 [Momordica charantia]|uniref:Pentatricopeptide repeat-containing protein At2g01860 isoform X1 n=1 Tax=Momordica charantia TaxID=3673 RepID=A0A6J1DI37_MOMCH|nr:pentatricopeptide repeat-containing protein At2g01860 isoform X1 [Momordica charantia]XP_022153120.1 pentatricopeptide repeat-containing protein At2g01860 isoform X2 [Momordica charantia]
MDCIFSSSIVSSIMVKGNGGISCQISMARFMANARRRLPKNLLNPRRTKLPPDPGVNQFLKNTTSGSGPSFTDFTSSEKIEFPEEEHDDHEEADTENYFVDDKDGEIIWDSDEIEAISSLFQGRIPQKPGKLNRERPLPLPLPHKLRPPGLPNPKIRARTGVPSRASLSKQVYKRPDFLIGLARAIRDLSREENVSKVLNRWAPFLLKGSLSLTIRELGHMGLADRALQSFCWAQEQPRLFPDDRVLASTVEVLSRNHELKVPLNLEEFTRLASRGVLEAMIRGFIKGGSLNLAWKLLVVAKKGNRMLDPSVYVKLILELGKNPDKNMLVLTLLDELGQREALKLNQQDTTAIMKVCTRLGKFEIAERLYGWYVESVHEPSVVMYTALIHSRYSEKKYREALSVVWEMEAANCPFDLPAYNVVIKLFVALGDLSRAARYFAKLKEAGFAPTYDIYRNLITIYLVSGRLAKCKEIYKEAKNAGFIIDKQITSRLLQCASRKMIRS